MIARFTKYLAAPVFPDEEKTRVVSLVNVILLIILALMIALPLITLLVAPAEAAIASMAAGIMAAITLGLLFLMRRGYVSVVSVLLISAFLAMVTWSIYSYRGVRDLTITGYFLVIALAGLLLGGRAALICGLLCLLLVAGVFFAETSGVITVSLEDTTPVFQLVTLMSILGLMALLLRFAVNSIAEGFGHARRSAQALAESNRDLEASRDALAERTRELEWRSTYLEASADVARVTSAILDPDELIQQTVALIRDRFDLYYAGLFLTDEAKEWAILHAGTGEAGQAMLARGHRIQVGEGMIGWSIANARTRIAQVAEEDATRLATPELPETRAEAALPLRSRGEVIGALTVQSDRPGAFDEATITVLQTMADQVAVALDNARLFAESQVALEAERRAYGEASRAAWAQLVSARAGTGYRYTRQTVVPAEGSWRPEMLHAAQTRQIVRGSGEGILAVPIKVRDQVVGVFNVHKATPGETWTDEEEALLKTLTDQLGVALESARLYQDTVRRAAHDRMVSEVTARVRETLDVDTVLQTAIREIGEALGMAEVEVRLYSGEVPSE